MTDEEKRAIEELKSLTHIYSYVVTYEKEYLLQCVEIILNLIESQQKELEKKDKVIHKMAEYINGLDIEEDICCNNVINVDWCEYSKCKECIKEYFERKVEENYDG